MLRMSQVPHPPVAPPVAVVVTATPRVVAAAQILQVAHQTLHHPRPTIVCIIVMIQVTRQIPIIP